jgi:hypothetical protein
MEITREQVRRDLRVYLSRTGMDLRRVADLTGFAHRSLIQFASGARYGAGDGTDTAAALKSFMDMHPWQPPDLPGHLYETAATREMDELIAYCRKGRWATLYGRKVSCSNTARRKLRATPNRAFFGFPSLAA